MTQPEVDPYRRAGRAAKGTEYPQPPTPGQSVAYLELAALPIAPFWARSYAGTALRAWRLWPEVIETAVLLVSELVTNSVKSADPGHIQLKYGDLASVEQISLTLRQLPGRVVIEVFDHSLNPPVLVDIDADAESGRGLMLVEALSKEWGHFFPPTGGKVVYVVIGT
jgi:anti-sigma regulatory factor (Ser/Thr protein kinase)